MVKRLPPAGSGLIFSFGSVGAIQLLNVVTGILLAQQLGPIGRGELAAVILWPTLLAFIGDLGVSEALTYYTARRRKPVGHLVGTALLLAAIQSVLFVAIGLVLVPVVLSQQAPHVVSTAVSFLIFIPVNMTMLNLFGIVNGLQRFAWFNGLRLLVYSVITVLLVVLATRNELTIQSAAFTYVVANLTALLVAGYVLATSGAKPLRLDRQLARELLSFGLRAQMSNVSLIFNERLDQLAMSAFLAPAQLGVYIVAVTVSSVAALIGTATALVTLPVVARDRLAARWKRDLPLFIRICLFMSAAVALPVFLLAPQVISVFFGSAFLPAVDVCRVLLVAAVVLSTNRVLAATLKGIGRPLDAGIAESVALGATVVGLAALLPALGILGAGIASVVAYTVSFLFMVHRVSTALGVKPLALAFPRGEVNSEGA